MKYLLLTALLMTPAAYALDVWNPYTGTVTSANQAGFDQARESRLQQLEADAYSQRYGSQLNKPYYQKPAYSTPSPTPSYGYTPPCYINCN